MPNQQHIVPDSEINELEDQSICSAVVEQAAEMLFLHDVDGKILKVNKATIQETGYTEEELLQMHVFNLDPDAQSRNAKEFAWNSDQMIDKLSLRLKHRRKDGSIYHAEARKGNIALNNKRYVLALARNLKLMLPSPLKVPIMKVALD